MKKQRLAYSYEDVSGDRHTVIVKEAKFGWTVVVIKNGITISQTKEMGSLMSVMNRAIVG